MYLAHIQRDAGKVVKRHVRSDEGLLDGPLRLAQDEQQMPLPPGSASTCTCVYMLLTSVQSALNFNSCSQTTN